MTDITNEERDETPVRGYKFVDRQLVPMTEEEADELEKDMEDLISFLIMALKEGCFCAHCSVH